MPMIDSQITEQTDQTITMKFTDKRANEYLMTVVKHPDYTVDELLQRWTRRANREYMTNPIMFERMFVRRINKRHEFLVNNPDQIR